MDGFDFLSRLRQLEEGKEVSVIVSTAKELTEEDRKRLEGSVNRILEKGSYDRSALLQEVRRQIHHVTSQSLPRKGDSVGYNSSCRRQ